MSRSTVIAIALICILITACSSPSEFATSPITNDQGQTVTFVRQGDLHGWFSQHRNLRIIALTGYSGNNGTIGYVVVYETPRVEK